MPRQEVAQFDPQTIATDGLAEMGTGTWAQGQGSDSLARGEKTLVTIVPGDQSHRGYAALPACRAKWGPSNLMEEVFTRRVGAPGVRRTRWDVAVNVACPAFGATPKPILGMPWLCFAHVHKLGIHSTRYTWQTAIDPLRDRSSCAHEISLRDLITEGAVWYGTGINNVLRVSDDQVRRCHLDEVLETKGLDCLFSCGIKHATLLMSWRSFLLSQSTTGSPRVNP